MSFYKNKKLWMCMNIILILGTSFLTGCHDDDNGSISSLLLDVTLQLAPGGCASASFTGQAGEAVDITATGPANQNPDLFVTDPTGAQVATAQTATLGVETLGLTPSVTGAFTVQVCDANNVGGAVRLTVIRRR